MTAKYSFQNFHFNVINHNDQIWFTSVEIAQALQYKSENSVNRIYSRNSAEFTCTMTDTIKSKVVRNNHKSVRIFSLHGTYLIAMFARTPIAKEFRKWVLDVLDKEVEATPIVKPAKQSPTHRYYVEVRITDNLLGGSIVIPGKSNTFKQIASGMSVSLGYKPTSFITVPNAMEELISRRI